MTIADDSDFIADVPPQNASLSGPPNLGDVSVAGDVLAKHPRWRRVSKYERWYEELCAKAKGRAIPTCYTEVHHIKPRSLGGSDDPSNLVRLTYREHYTAHHLLTKFHTGINLVKMQKALMAMTMNVSGERKPTAWRVEAAKRAVRDIELNDEKHEAWYNRRRNKRQAEFKAQRELEMEQEAQDWADAIETAKMFSPEAVAKVLARKAKRDASVKQWGWHRSPDVPGPKQWESV